MENHGPFIKLCEKSHQLSCETLQVPQNGGQLKVCLKVWADFRTAWETKRCFTVFCAFLKLRVTQKILLSISGVEKYVILLFPFINGTVKDYFFLEIVVSKALLFRTADKKSISYLGCIHT